MKVLICYSRITPRLAARVECLARLVPEIVALSLADAEDAYPWWQGCAWLHGVRHDTLLNGAIDRLPAGMLKASVRQYVERERPTIAVIAGYNLSALRYLAKSVKRQGGKTVLVAVTWAADRRRFFVKETLKGWLVRSLFDAVCVGGERSRSYFMSLGFRQYQLWKCFNVVDNKHFAEGAEQARKHDPELRIRLGLPERFFLFVGALEPWKNPEFLLECYARYRAGGGSWGLVFVGTGSLESALREKVSGQRLPDVMFAGMKRHEQTPMFYGLGSCLILPSLSETWGLVVNEAEAAGLPVLVSDRCGCVPELVHRGINGYVFEPRDADTLILQMHLVSGGVLDLAAMGRASAEIVSYYTPERWACVLADCVRYLRGARSGCGETRSSDLRMGTRAR